jgi:cation diffusion facilitator CzcD-associated flavoprotein CzcO
MESTIPPLPKPYVLIAGAGLGGLLMGTLLQRIGIPYHIFERAAKVKPLGNYFPPPIHPQSHDYLYAFMGANANRVHSNQLKTSNHYLGVARIDYEHES